MQMWVITGAGWHFSVLNIRSQWPSDVFDLPATLFAGPEEWFHLTRLCIDVSKLEKLKRKIFFSKSDTLYTLCTLYTHTVLISAF